jgi:hypothetical protein
MNENGENAFYGISIIKENLFDKASRSFFGIVGSKFISASLRRPIACTTKITGRRLRLGLRQRKRCPLEAIPKGLDTSFTKKAVGRNQI